MTHLIPGFESTASALAAQKIHMQMISENIANAQTTKDVNGKPYQRKIVAFETLMDHSDPSNNTVHVRTIQKDKAPDHYVYNPGHPHANSQGMVQMPNVKVSQEMVDMMMASRLYEANLKAFKLSQNMAQKTIQIGK